MPALHPHALKTYRELGCCDTPLRRQGLGRFRVNLHSEPTIRQDLSMALTAVLTQTLLPGKGKGRVPERAAASASGNYDHRTQGSFTLEGSLAELVRRGILTPEDARNRTVHQEEMDRLLR